MFASPASPCIFALSVNLTSWSGARDFATSMDRQSLLLLLLGASAVCCVDPAALVAATAAKRCRRSGRLAWKCSLLQP
jgi:hypothetical protein